MVEVFDEHRWTVVQTWSKTSTGPSVSPQNRAVGQSPNHREVSSMFQACSSQISEMSQSKDIKTFLDGRQHVEKAVTSSFKL